MVNYSALKNKEVRNVIDGKCNASRVPVILHFWIHPESFGPKKEIVNGILAEYPCDIEYVNLNTPQMYIHPSNDRSYRWMNSEDPYSDTKAGIDEQIAIKDWRDFDDILKHWPDPNSKHLIPHVNPYGSRYRLAYWWYGFFENHWTFRGMQNALTDPHLHPECVHKFYKALTDFYLVAIERAKKELNADGIFFSDDLGMQHGSFFDLSTFRNFYKPYYKQLIDKAHSLDMHLWLHTCGKIDQFIPDFIEIGLDVIHPIQKYTMDEKKISEAYGSDICIWGGFDVQQIIPWGNVEQVKKEVRFMYDTYQRPDGKFIFGAGNGINQDCPIESLEVLFETAYGYAGK